MLRWCLVFTAGLLWSADSAPASFRAHVVAEAGIILSVPADWREQPYQSGTALVLRSPVQSGPADERSVATRERARAAVSVVTTRLDAGVTLAVFARSCRADLERVGTHVQIDEDVAVERTDLPLHRLRYRIDLGPYTFVQVLHVMVLGTTGVCVTAGCGAEAWPRWQADCTAVGAGLRRSGTAPGL